MPIGTIVGLAVSIGAGIWKKSKAKRAVTQGRSKQQLLLILRYRKYIMGDFSTDDYGKMDGREYQAASDFFTGFFGVKIEEDDNIKGLFLEGGKAYLRMQDSKHKDTPLEDCIIGHNLLKRYTGNITDYGTIWKQPNRWDITKHTMPDKIPGHSSYVATAFKTADQVTGTVPQGSVEELQEFSKTWKLENPLKTYWYIFLAPVVLLLGFLAYKRVKSK